MSRISHSDVQYGREHLDLVVTFLGPIHLESDFSCPLILKDYTKQ